MYESDVEVTQIKAIGDIVRVTCFIPAKIKSIQVEFKTKTATDKARTADFLNMSIMADFEECREAVNNGNIDELIANRRMRKGNSWILDYNQKRKTFILTKLKGRNKNAFYN